MKEAVVEWIPTGSRTSSDSEHIKESLFLSQEVVDSIVSSSKFRALTESKSCVWCTQPPLAAGSDQVQQLDLHSCLPFTQDCLSRKLTKQKPNKTKQQKIESLEEGGNSESFQTHVAKETPPCYPFHPAWLSLSLERRDIENLLLYGMIWARYL